MPHAYADRRRLPCGTAARYLCRRYRPAVPPCPSSVPHTASQTLLGTYHHTLSVPDTAYHARRHLPPCTMSVPDNAYHVPRHVPCFGWVRVPQVRILRPRGPGSSIQQVSTGERVGDRGGVVPGSRCRSRPRTRQST
eukprot:2868624-Rhodomonas_salina.1